MFNEYIKVYFFNNVQSLIEEHTMKIILLCLILGTTLGAPGKDLTIQEFEEKFHQKFASVKDEADAAKELALKEAEIDEQNEKFAKGEANFEEELEPWDDLSLIHI